MISKFETVCKLMHSDTYLTVENNETLKGIDIKEPFYFEIRKIRGKWVGTVRYWVDGKLYNHTTEFSDETVDFCNEHMNNGKD